MTIRFFSLCAILVFSLNFKLSAQDPRLQKKVESQPKAENHNLELHKAIRQATLEILGPTYQKMQRELRRNPQLMREYLAYQEAGEKFIEALNTEVPNEKVLARQPRFRVERQKAGLAKIRERFSPLMERLFAVAEVNEEELKRRIEDAVIRIAPSFLIDMGMRKDLSPEDIRKAFNWGAFLSFNLDFSKWEAFLRQLDSPKLVQENFPAYDQPFFGEGIGEGDSLVEIKYWPEIGAYAFVNMNSLPFVEKTVLAEYRIAPDFDKEDYPYGRARVQTDDMWSELWAASFVFGFFSSATASTRMTYRTFEDREFFAVRCEDFQPQGHVFAPFAWSDSHEQSNDGLRLECDISLITNSAERAGAIAVTSRADVFGGGLANPASAFMNLKVDSFRIYAFREYADWDE